MLKNSLSVTHNNNLFIVTVAGSSMEPILHDGERFCLKKQKRYYPGDIVVFPYKNEGLLVHRLLLIDNSRYFCKGDNSYRLEDIVENEIIGRVIVDDPNNNSDFIISSYKIAKLFRHCHFNKEVLIQQDEYKDYYNQTKND